jgi:hypothetical protein
VAFLEGASDSDCRHYSTEIFFTSSICVSFSSR